MGAWRNISPNFCGFFENEFSFFKKKKKNLKKNWKTVPWCSNLIHNWVPLYSIVQNHTTWTECTYVCKKFSTRFTFVQIQPKSNTGSRNHLPWGTLPGGSHVFLACCHVPPNKTTKLNQNSVSLFILWPLFSPRKLSK